MGNVKTCQDVKTRWRERKSGAWVPLSCKKEFKRMWKSELVSHHVVGPVSDGLVPRSRDTLLGVSVTEAASLHYQVVDGKVSGGRVLVCRGEVFGLARTRLTLQQPDSDVGHPQLLLALRPERIQGFPLWQRAVDHLLVREGDLLSHLLAIFQAAKDTTETWNLIRNHIKIQLSGPTKTELHFHLSHCNTMRLTVVSGK